MTDRHIAILGAGPTGLEAALSAAQAGHSFTVYEASPHVAGNVRAWGHVRLFTPWSMNVSPRIRERLAEVGQEPPDSDEGCPTGRELVDRVFQPVAELPEISPNLRLDTRVVQIGRAGLLKSDEIGTGGRARRPFRLLLREAGGVERIEEADVVLDCSGTYDNPNALGAGGIRAPGEVELDEYVIRRIPEIEAPHFSADAPGWAGMRILLVGAGHSAQTTARDLAELVERAPGTEVTWVIRSDEPTFGAVEDDPLPARDALVRRARSLASDDSPFDVRRGREVHALEASPEGIVVTLRGPDVAEETVVVDRIISLTGAVGDAHMYRQLQVHECYATLGPMRLAAALLSSGSADCLTQEGQGVDALKNPEPDFFILGSKSYGRNPTFLMRVGWEQVEEVFGLLGAVEPAEARSEAAEARSETVEARSVTVEARSETVETR